jgi:DNA-binding FadR family transcriptional regulator
VIFVDGFGGRAHDVARLVAAMAIEATPATKLGTKEELREQFGVSSATMSESLRLLQSRGLVSLRTGPGGGVFSAAPSGRLMLSNLLVGFNAGAMTVHDVLESREALEPAVGRAAAERRSATDLRELRKVLSAMRRNLGDPEQYLRLNWHLHRRIAESCGNEVLSGIYSSLVRFLEDELTQAMAAASFEEHRNENLALHSELVDAIAARDAVHAAELAAHHAPASILERVNGSVPSSDRKQSAHAGR